MLFSLLSQRPYVWLGGSPSGLKLASTCVRVMRGKPLQDVFVSIRVIRFFNYPLRSINVYVSGMNDARAVSLGQKNVVLYLCSISQTHLRNDISFIYTRHGEKTYLRRMGLPYARENIINQTTTATSRATQSLTKKSLLTAPYYHSLSCDMNIIDESSLNVVFSPEILYRAFENHAISRGGEWNRISPFVFINANLPLHLYPISNYRFVSCDHILHWKKIIWNFIYEMPWEVLPCFYSFGNMYVVCLCVYKV